MKEYLLISDAAKEVQVESHVLRYWEEELNLPIRRNELGHRYYTSEDVERFRQIKELKDRGLQLRAIKSMLGSGRLEQTESDTPLDRVMGITILESRELTPEETEREKESPVSKEERAKKIEMLLRHIIRETIKESSQELYKEIRDSVVKELEYQFRAQEERENEVQKRNEEYYRRIDELLREKKQQNNKKKRHFFF